MIPRRVRPRHLARPRLPVLVLAMCCGSTVGWSEETPPAKPAAHPIFSDTTRPTTAPPPMRSSPSTKVSPLLSNAIKEKLPPYTPPANVKADETPTDAIKLPPVLVNAPKLRLPDEAETLSPADFAARLRKMYPGASAPGQDPYHIANGMPNYGRLAYEQDRRNEQVTSLKDLADLTERSGDRELAKKIKKQVQGTFGSTYKDPLIEAMDKAVNGGRR